MTEIKSAFKAQLVDTSIIRLDDVVDAAQNSEPWSWFSEYSRLGIADCLKELEGWAAFDDTPKKSNPTSSPSTARQSSAVQPGVRIIAWVNNLARAVPVAMILARVPAV